MTDVNDDEDRWWMARRLLRYLVEGLVLVGYTWMVSPPPPRPPLPPGRLLP